MSLYSQEIYDFSTPSGRNWRYADYDQEIIVAGTSYPKTIIERGRFGIGESPSKRELSITLPVDNPMAKLLYLHGITEPLWVRIRRPSDADPTQYVGQFYGTASAISVSGQRVTLTCQQLIKLMQQNPLLQRTLQPTCSHLLYSPPCGVDAVANTFATTALLVNGKTVTVSADPAKAVNYYQNGVLKVLDGEESGASYYIDASNGQDMVLLGTPRGITIGTQINIKPGCDRVYTTCRDKFSNLDNMGGWHYMPTKNVYEGTRFI